MRRRRSAWPYNPRLEPRKSPRLAEFLRRQGDAAGALALFAINAFITSRLFHVAYLRQMGSIEGAFIGLARYIRDHFPHLTWFPLWYGGIPFADSYPPLVHLVVAGVAAATGASPGLAYHIVMATAYALGPVALFWAAMQLGARRTPAFLAALGYSLISPSCWIVPQIRLETSGWLGPRRLLALIAYGEGPHIASLVLLPLAIGLTHRAVASRKPRDFVVAALAVAATVMSNWIGALILAWGLAAYVLAGFGKFWKPVWTRTAAIGIYAYAIALPWATPSTIATIRASAPKLVGFRSSGLGFGLLCASLPLLAWGLARLRILPPLRFAALLIYGPAVLALGSYWFHRDLLPQANRYHLELDLAIWLAVALGVSLYRFQLRGMPAWLKDARVWIALTALVALPLIRHQYRRARNMETPIDIQSTAEYQISHWLGEHLPGRRVFAPGSVSFWMTAFSDTPMLVGGFDNGISNQELWEVNYQLLFGDKPEVALAWLRAFGCDAIVGNDPESREAYHPYSHPARLHGLPELWRSGPEVIYAVPRRGSLAHVVHPENLVPEVPAPYDPKLLAPYVAALEEPALALASFRWRDPDSASITAQLETADLLSVQITWAPGWKARVNGEARRVWGDKLGQVVVEPRCHGACTVELAYDGGFELAFARWACVLALLGGAAWMGLAKRPWHRSSGSTTTS
jgi:hypothetical protein